MSKKTVVLLFFVFVLGFVSNILVNNLVYPLENNYILMNGNRVEIQGGISYINLTKLERELKYTPGYNNDATIVVMRDKLVNPEGQTIKGMYKDGIIYVNSAHVDSVLHEIGHVIDEKYGYLSENEDFLEIYNLIEHKNHHTNSAEEYFAESYKEYAKGDLQNQELIKLFDAKFQN